MITEERIGDGLGAPLPARGAATPNGAGKRPRQAGARLRFRFVWTTLEAFRLASASLRANKLRSGLTLVGIVVGVAAVIAVVTIIKGLDQTVAQTFSSQGSTVFSVSQRPQVILSREDFIRYNKRREMTHEDAEAVMRHCTLCLWTGVAVNTAGTVKHGNQKSEGVLIRGITLSMLPIDDINVEAGREWSESEAQAAREVAIVGADVVENLFGGIAPEQVLGQTVRVEGREYRIVGVPERLGKIFGVSRDNYVYLPYETYRKTFGANAGTMVVFAQAPDAASLEATEEQVRAVMQTRRRSFGADDEGFTIETQAVFLDLYSKATDNIYLVTVGVAAISLVVGGIVVMNIMLVSVTERTKEVGLRKAVGARRRDVLTQFMIEAVMLTAAGGAAGVLFGFGLAFALSKAMGFPLLLSAWSAVLGVGVSSAVGIVSGLWPAWTAARLDPIDALRAE
ncbi:MAG TPA: ABC transporter permease [Pyrinomonadaceae bacterium]|nr:ABC transporter permease [Pyrinomonadaceae bacterium]